MVKQKVERLLGDDGGDGLSAKGTLKNVGFICSGCSAAHHEDCDIEKDKTKKLCVCFYSMHPYLSKEQLTPKVKKPDDAIIGVGATVHHVGDKAPRLAEKVR